MGKWVAILVALFWGMSVWAQDFEPLYQIRESEPEPLSRRERRQLRRVSLEQLEHPEQIDTSEMDALLDTLTGDLDSLPPLPSMGLRAIPMSDTLRVALLLPLTHNGAAEARYTEFYQGFLFGLNRVKSLYDGHLRVDLFDTDRDTMFVQLHQIAEDPDFQAAHLVVGPVYEEQIAEILPYVAAHSTPIVSPLADIGRIESDLVFQMTPSADHKFDKLRDMLLTEPKQVTLLYGQSNDMTFEREVRAALDSMGVAYSRFDYNFGFQSTQASVNKILQDKADKIIVVLSNNPTEVDRILASFASSQANLTARGFRLSPVSIMGNPLWIRFDNLDRTHFFQNRVFYFTNHYAQRNNTAAKQFDKEYIRAFGVMPTPYSHRGYDAAMIFIPAMRGNISTGLEGLTYTPLTTTYRFVDRENQTWMRISYNREKEKGYFITVD